MVGAFNNQEYCVFLQITGTLMEHIINNMKDVDMIHIQMNKRIFGRDKIVYLDREDLLHYCGIVEIGYMCMLTYMLQYFAKGFFSYNLGILIYLLRN